MGMKDRLRLKVFRLKGSDGLALFSPVVLLPHHSHSITVFVLPSAFRLKAFSPGRLLD
jgi:hypothetical protein